MGSSYVDGENPEKMKPQRNCNGDLYIGILVGLMLCYVVVQLWRIFNL